MTATSGYLTFDQVDSDIEYELGGSFNEFEFVASGALDSPSGTIRHSEGVFSDNTQSCNVLSSNGSNHRNYCLDDRIIKVQEYVSSSWVTTLEVAFVAKTSTGFRANVITANAGIPVLIKART